MREMNITKFRQLVVGEKFRLPGSEVVLLKETLRQEPGLGWVNASSNHPQQEPLCYFPNETQVVRRRSNESQALRLKGSSRQYQCIQCQKWVEENDAAMSKEGVMCLDCYTLLLKRKKERDRDDTSPATLQAVPG
jgi:DNA-directed RNA polymerase subunit RPC12/RpoP